MSYRLACRFHGTDDLIERGTAVYESGVINVEIETPRSISGFGPDLVNYTGDTEYEIEVAQQLICVSSEMADRQLCGLVIAEYDHDECAWLTTENAVWIDGVGGER